MLSRSHPEFIADWARLICRPAFPSYKHCWFHSILSVFICLPPLPLPLSHSPYSFPFSFRFKTKWISLILFKEVMEVPFSFQRFLLKTGQCLEFLWVYSKVLHLLEQEVKKVYKFSSVSYWKIGCSFQEQQRFSVDRSWDEALSYHMVYHSLVIKPQRLWNSSHFMEDKEYIVYLHPFSFLCMFNPVFLSLF